MATRAFSSILDDRVQARSSSSGISDLFVRCGYVPRGGFVEDSQGLLDHEFELVASACIGGVDYLWYYGMVLS